jgi:hypothetical protein
MSVNCRGVLSQSAEQSPQKQTQKIAISGSVKPIEIPEEDGENSSQELEPFRAKTFLLFVGISFFFVIESIYELSIDFMPEGLVTFLIGGDLLVFFAGVISYWIIH